MNDARQRQFRLTGAAVLAVISLAGTFSCSSAQAQSLAAETRIRQPQFDVDYQLGDSRASTVELWYTDDNSKSWKLYGVDADRVSPISFTAPHEGLYGFLVIARNKAGASAPNPTAGTAPTFWCFVDWHRPQVQITGPVPTPSADGASDVVTLTPKSPLPIRYTALDDNLIDKPIRIEYRPANDVQWRQIVSDKANTGQCDWAVPDGVTGPFLIRVTAVDRAGNVGVASTLREMEIRRQEHVARPTPPAVAEGPGVTIPKIEPPRTAVDNEPKLPDDSKLPQAPAVGLGQLVLPTVPENVEPVTPKIDPPVAPTAAVNNPPASGPNVTEPAFMDPPMIAEQDALGMFVLNYTCVEPMTVGKLDPILTRLQGAMTPLVQAGQLSGPIGVTLKPVPDSMDLVKEVRLYAVIPPAKRTTDQAAIIAANVEKNVGKMDGIVQTQFVKLVEPSQAVPPSLPTGPAVAANIVPGGDQIASAGATGNPGPVTPTLDNERPTDATGVAPPSSTKLTPGVTPEPEQIVRPRPVPDDPAAAAGGRQNVQIEFGPSHPAVKLGPSDPPAPVPTTPGIVSEPPRLPAPTAPATPVNPPRVADNVSSSPTTGQRPEVAVVGPEPAPAALPGVQVSDSSPSPAGANVTLPEPPRVAPTEPSGVRPPPTAPLNPTQTPTPTAPISPSTLPPAVAPAPSNPLAGVTPGATAMQTPPSTVTAKAVASVDPAKQAAAREVFKAGVAAYAAGDRPRAADCYLRAVEADPNMVEAYINLAGLQMLAKQYDQAEQNYSRAVGLDPDRPQALFGLGSVQLLRRNPAAARQTLARLVQVRATDAAAWVLYGDACIGVKETGTALSAWREADRLSPSTQVGKLARDRIAKYGPRN